MLIKNEHNSSYKQQLDGFDLIDQEYKLNTQLLELDKIQVGVENMSYVFDYVVTTIDNKQPIVKELVNHNINNSLELMGLEKYEVLDGTESFSDIMGKISDFISYIFKSIITLIKKIIEFIINIIKSIIDFFRDLFNSKRTGGGNNGETARDTANRQIREVEDAITKQRNDPDSLTAKKKQELKDDIKNNDDKIKDTLKNLPTYLLLSDGKINITSLITYMDTILKSLKTLMSPHASTGYMGLYELSHKYSDVKNENMGTLLSNQLRNLSENTYDGKDFTISLNNIFNSNGTTFKQVIDNLSENLNANDFKIDSIKMFSDLEEKLKLKPTSDDKEIAIINITVSSIITIERLKDDKSLIAEINNNITTLEEAYNKNIDNNRDNNVLTVEEAARKVEEEKKKKDISALKALNLYLEIVKNIYEVGKITLKETKLQEDVYKEHLNKVKIELTEKSSDVAVLTGFIEDFFEKISNINDFLNSEQENIENDLEKFNKNMNITLKELDKTSKKSDKFIKNISDSRNKIETEHTLKLVKEFTKVYTSMQKDVSSETAKIVSIIKHEIKGNNGKGPYDHMKTLERLLVDNSKYNILLNM